MKMNKLITSPALINPNVSSSCFCSAFFHSTPFLDRRRRTHWNSRSSGNYSKRFRKYQSKQSLFQNVNAYAEFMFQRWEEEPDDDDPFGRGPSWFKQYWTKNFRGERTGKQRQQHWGRRGFQFCEDDIDVETIFRSTFGGNHHFYWSFVDDEFPHWRSWSSHSRKYRKFGNWSYYTEEEDGSLDSENSYSQLTSHRQALGLSASGPLKLEDVKNAYRACALKWHPDRHQGSSKVMAEEKFKHCSEAYQSLCDKLALN